MTEEQIKQAAYALCKLRKLDPEEGIRDSSEKSGVDCLVKRERWVLVAKEIKAHLQIQEVIDFVLKNEPE